MWVKGVSVVSFTHSFHLIWFFFVSVRLRKLSVISEFYNIISKLWKVYFIFLSLKVFFNFRVCHIKETIVFSVLYKCKFKIAGSLFHKPITYFFYLVVSVKSRKLSLFLFLETLIKNCGRFIFYICQYSFYCFVVSVRLRKLSIISDFITETVGLKTFLFI